MALPADTVDLAHVSSANQTMEMAMTNATDTPGEAPRVEPDREHDLAEMPSREEVADAYRECRQQLDAMTAERDDERNRHKQKTDRQIAFIVRQRDRHEADINDLHGQLDILIECGAQAEQQRDTQAQRADLAEGRVRVLEALLSEVHAGVTADDSLKEYPCDHLRYASTKVANSKCVGCEIHKRIEIALAAAQPEGADPAPVSMALHCPECNEQHIDDGEWATKPHKTHLDLSPRSLQVSCQDRDNAARAECARLRDLLAKVERLGVQTHYHVAEQLGEADIGWLLTQLTDIYATAMEATPTAAPSRSDDAARPDGDR